MHNFNEIPRNLTTGLTFPLKFLAIRDVTGPNKLAIDIVNVLPNCQSCYPFVVSLTDTGFKCTSPLCTAHPLGSVLQSSFATNPCLGVTGGSR